ncbi:hypothetical protein [Empedobacter sp. GD03739]|uniref:hypothetical protein n=1 Tax=Empedobacter sp. GD03739 TaxID=2975376 RepID=UPI0024498050|nr:hypothetical protein [Empedobacter sp. GD03739]MDH1602342.1 hypothetical protein [Empedobacter sp. GD03739]
MILTDKAKEDFKEWVFENYYFQDLNVLYPLHLIDTLIIEFFDSVGIYIEIHYSRILGDKFLCIVNTEANYNLTSYQDSRQQATEQAIKKANDLYNSRYENV